MLIKNRSIIFLTCFLTLTFSESCYAQLENGLERLKNAYPNHIKSYDEYNVTWTDNTKMAIEKDKINKSLLEKLNSPSFYDQLTQPIYIPGKPQDAVSYHPVNDAGRVRYEPFFRKLYGNTVKEVENKLVTIYWMPATFGKRYPLLVTTVNSVDVKLTRVSEELDKLVKMHPEYRKYLENPGGTFDWRKIANTDRVSAHSFGMTIDINTDYSNYWQWDLKRASKPINETVSLSYKNQIPWDIVLIFEKQGFIWGGKWYHYDTMHFEYRPEMFPLSH